jgi:hypothetical protein
MPPSVPSLLDYARYHGVANEHLALDLDLSACLDTIQDALPGSLSCIAPPIALPKETKLRLNTSELQLLATGIRPPPPLPLQLDEILPDPHRIRSLKLEIPLLLTDHEEDLRCFTERPSLNLHDLGVLPERIGSPASDLARYQDVKLSRERLQASKEDFLYLQHTLKAPYTPEVYQQVIEDALPSYTHVSLTSCVKISQSPCKLTYRDQTAYLVEEEIELEEDNFLKDIQTQSEPVSRKRPTSPLVTHVLHNPNQPFSVTNLLLNFMTTRGGIKRQKVYSTYHFS